MNWLEFRLGVVLAGLVSCVGCGTVPEAGLPALVVRQVGQSGAEVGEVVFVRPGLGYVVVSGANLPLAGSEAQVYRDEVAVGTVRFDGPRNPGFATADIVHGIVQTGDRVVF